MNKCIDCLKQNHCKKRSGSHKYCFTPKHKTNYDRIRDMSIEEMATLLDCFSACSRCRRNGNNCFPVHKTKEWLESEVEE